MAIPSPIKLPDKDKEKYSVLSLKFFECTTCSSAKTEKTKRIVTAAAIFRIYPSVQLLYNKISVSDCTNSVKSGFKKWQKITKVDPVIGKKSQKPKKKFV